jgi:L-arabinose isomerase
MRCGMLEDFATIAIIDAKTNVREFQQQLRNSKVFYTLKKGWAI